MEGKRKNVYITIFVITTIIASCVAVYFGIEANKIGENTIQEGKVEEVATDEVEKEKTIVEIKEVEKIVEKYVVPEINQDKCINGNEESIYDVYRKAEFTEFYATLKSPNLVEISYFPRNLATYYKWLDIGDTIGNKSANISFSNTKVVNVYIVGMGHAPGAENLFFLMEDGTVEYMPLAHAIKNNKFESYGKVEGVTDIVDIIGGNVGSKQGGGYYSSFAIRKDGSFFDMGSILSKLDYYNIY